MMPPTLINGSAGRRSSVFARNFVFWMTGIAFIIWAMASGDVRFSTSLRDHHGVPKLALVDVESLARRLPTSEPGGEDPPEPERMTGTPGRIPSSREPRD